MLALIAATAFETRLLRQELTATEPLAGGFPVFHGNLRQQQVRLVHSGVGKANAAAAATALLCSCRPTALISFGCGGAFDTSGLKNGDLALASAEIFADDGSNSASGFLDLEALGLPLWQQGSSRLYNRIPVNPHMFASARDSLGRFAAESGIQLETGPFVTVSTCTGTDQQGHNRASVTGGICENMEGAASALVAVRFDIPFLELRGISNRAGNRNRQEWDLAGACRIAELALLALLPDWPGGGS